MASSSSSSSSSWDNPHPKYDVFLSFRGSDTRKGFLSFLHDSLLRNHIDTFIDNNLERGEPISPSLLDKIQNSLISIIIFSQNYANSEWCLEELCKIHECVQKNGQMVLPVFYHVDPTDVRELTGSYGRAMSMHKDKFGGGPGMVVVDSWIQALKDISAFGGLASQDTESEAKLVEDIIGDICKKIEFVSSSDFQDGFVGMDARVKEVETLLNSASVVSVGIWGMGGIGKTALAENLLNKLHNDFEGYCFVNVREELEKCSPNDLRSQILSLALGVQGLSIGTPSILPVHIRQRLRNRRILMVLDDVSSHQELEMLAGQRSLYCPRSRIIVTSRDKQVLEKWCDETFEVKKLTYHQGLQLFKLHALEEDNAKEELLELSQRVVKYVDGIPLALKVLGSNLYKKSLEEWESTLVKLENIPDKEITEILKISYDGLEQHEQCIFLDIACFFKGADKNHVERVLNACEFYATHGIRSLIDKCLVTISNDKLRMHDLLQQMGHNIVRKECLREPGKRSRLWDHNEIYNVLSRNKGTESVEGMVLDMSKSKEMELSSSTFTRMHNLRLLNFYNRFPQKVKLSLPGGLEFLPDELRLLSWCQFPLESLPSSFSPEYLVELRMPDSQVKQLWDGKQSFRNLKIMDLSYSEDLTKIPDFLQVPNLEDLDLTGCSSLDEVPSSIGELRNLTSLNLKHCKRLENIPSSIQQLKKLAYLNVKGCKRISQFPSCLHMKNLYFLSLENCSMITEFPEIPLNIQVLQLGGTSIEYVPSSIENYSQLITLDLHSCKRLVSLPINIGSLKCLQQLHISECSKLSRPPTCIFDLKFLRALTLTCLDPEGLTEELGNLESLERLMIVNSPIRKLPSSLSRLTKLGYLTFWGCQGLLLPDCSGLKSLTTLILINCGLREIPHTIGTLSPLVELKIMEDSLVSLHPNIMQLSRLEFLSARGCGSLQSLPGLPPALGFLNVENCTSLEYVPTLLPESPPEQGTGGMVANFGNCINLSAFTCTKLIDDAKQIIQRFSTYMFNQEFDYQVSNDELEVNFITSEVRLCIPGNEVPCWFQYQSPGSSVTVAPNGHDVMDFCRVAFSAVVACNGNYNSDDFDIMCECQLKTHSGEYLDLNSYYYSPDPVDIEHSSPIMLQSSHLFLWYNSTGFYLSQRYFKEATFEFYVVDGKKERVLNCEIVQCGVTLMERKCEDSVPSYAGEYNDDT